MDVAKRLADWRDRPPEQWFTAINRYLPPGVTAVLVIAIAYQLATLTWTLVPGSTPVVTPVARPAAGTGSAPPASNYGALKNAHLFGEAAKQPATVVPAVVDAPDTTLNLILRGILSKEEDPNGSVIIESLGQSKTYYVGGTIEGADGATLHSVYSDRVLLNRNGRLETLRLPKELTASARSPAMAVPMPQRTPQAQPQASLRDVISENASRLTDIMRPTPHVQEGQVVGFRLNPGRDRATFEALGFQPGDVVTDINGTVLDDPSQGLAVFQALGESTQANVTVLRDGVPQVIVIDTSQIQSLQENRE